MSHLRPEARSPHKMAYCRRGSHLYGPTQIIGAGIQRQVCKVCNGVTIDLTQADTSNSSVLVQRKTISELKA
ncbi:MAG TPA: hypothetical protein VIW94_04195 [Acidimicrobiia bacterium]